jgi:hypothetical protein
VKKQCTCIEQALNKYSIFNIQIVLKKQGTSREKQGTSIETVHDPTTDLHDDRGCLRLPNTQRWCVRESFATCARMTGKIEGSGTRGTDVCHTAGEERCLRNWLNRWYAGVWREA